MTYLSVLWYNIFVGGYFMQVLGKIFKFLFGLIFYSILGGMAVGGIFVMGYFMMLAYAQGKEAVFYGVFVGLIVVVFWAIVLQCLRAWFPKDIKSKKAPVYQTYPDASYYQYADYQRPQRAQRSQGSSRPRRY